MLIEDLLKHCDERQKEKCKCKDCNIANECNEKCGNCLEYIHFPQRAPESFKGRKYDCPNMADFYTCRYVCRYTSEMIYALRRMKSMKEKETLKVLSFGCGPCTDLLALQHLRTEKAFKFSNLEYRGIDYSKVVWERIHTDIKEIFNDDNHKAKFYYFNACEKIDEIGSKNWIPDIVVFQYFFSDMQKHTGENDTLEFIGKFAQFFNNKALPNSIILLNDINLTRGRDGGREYFDDLYNSLDNADMKKGRFRDDNAKSDYYPHGYPYGDDSEGEFPHNENFFDITKLDRYSPFDTCASAQMIIRKRE